MKKRYSVLLGLGMVVVIALLYSETIVLHLVGIQELEAFSQEEYERSVEELKDVYSDSAQFIVSTKEQFVAYSSLVEAEKQFNLTKPIQLLYFEGNKLVSFHSSCNVPMNYWTWKYEWNFESRFKQYPPKSSIPVFAIDLQQIKQIYPFLLDSEHQHTVLVFWSRLMEKQVYEAVRIMIENQALCQNERDVPKLVFINVDQAFLGKIADEENE